MHKEVLVVAILYIRGGQIAARAQRFQWPAAAFRKLFKSEISSNFSQ